MILDSINRKIQAVLTSAITTTNPTVTSDWIDLTTLTTTAGFTPTNLNGTTIVDIISAPSASTQRKVNNITVYNADTAACECSIRYNDNGSSYGIIKSTLLPGESLCYTDVNGWFIIQASSAFNNLQSQIYTKLSKSGDTMTGTLIGTTINSDTISGTSITATNYYGNGSNLVNSFTGMTIVNFGFQTSGEGDFTASTISNSNVNQNSNILFKLSASTDHPNTEESLLEGIYFKESDIIDGVSFVLNAYANNSTWGEYNVIYKIIN